MSDSNSRRWPSRPDAANPSVAPSFHIQHQRRRVADLERSAALLTLMRSFSITAALLMTTCFVHAGFAGFEVGGGVALTDGVVRVNFMLNKSLSLSLGPRLHLRLTEVQLTMTDGRVKRHTMVFYGTHALKAPLPIELTETLGLLCLLVLVCGITLLLSSRLRRAEPGASRNGGPAKALGNSNISGGPRE